MENWLNTGLGRDFLNGISRIGKALFTIAERLDKDEKDNYQHWRERRMLAFEIFKREVEAAELIPQPGEPMSNVIDSKRVEHYARKSFEAVDIFLMSERLEKKP